MPELCGSLSSEGISYLETAFPLSIWALFFSEGFRLLRLRNFQETDVFELRWLSPAYLNKWVTKKL